MIEMVTPLENLNIGDVFILARDAEAGLSISDVIMDAINCSRKLLHVIGYEQNVAEQEWFFSLHLAMVERLEDIIIVYKEVSVFESLQKRI